MARFLGRRLAYTYEVVEPVPGERLVMRTAQARSRWRRRTRGPCWACPPTDTTGLDATLELSGYGRR
ncbi:hypothetical protein [Dactylosporangium sp. NPDC049140]|uniref:hypothetical protein n=1 Tax=Dactylosporangium sp. NPDC049140 TaxID=3155647 RepID=UPI0033FF6E43